MIVLLALVGGSGTGVLCGSRVGVAAVGAEMGASAAHRRYSMLALFCHGGLVGVVC